MDNANISFEMITAAEIVKMHGEKFTVNTARKRIREVLKAKKIKNRSFITVQEYCEFFDFKKEAFLASM